MFTHSLFLTSCHGDTNHLSISSDILKKFNPTLKGFSKGQLALQKGFNMAVSGAKTSYVHILLIPPCEWNFWIPHCHLTNAAAYVCFVTVSSEHKSKLSSRLWKKTRWDCVSFKTMHSWLQCLFLMLTICIYNTQAVNFETDWKLLTLFIGANDLCHYCLDQVSDA